MEYSTPALFNLSYLINGKLTACGINKYLEEGKEVYTVCATIEEQSMEYKMGYDSETRLFRFNDSHVPKDLRLLEEDISFAIHLQAKSELTDFLNETRNTEL